MVQLSSKYNKASSSARDIIPNRDALAEFVDACVSANTPEKLEIALRTPESPIFILYWSSLDGEMAAAEELILLMRRLAAKTYLEKQKEKEAMLKDSISRRTQLTDPQLRIQEQRMIRETEKSLKDKSLDELKQWAVQLPADIQALQDKSQTLKEEIARCTSNIEAAEARIQTARTTQGNAYVAQLQQHPAQFVSATTGEPVVLSSDRINAVHTALNGAGTGTLSNSFAYNQGVREMMHQLPLDQEEKLQAIHNYFMVLLRVASALNAGEMGGIPAFIGANKTKLSKVPQCVNNTDMNDIIKYDREKLKKENELRTVDREYQRSIHLQDKIAEIIEAKEKIINRKKT